MKKRRNMYVRQVRLRELLAVTRLEEEIYPADTEHNGIVGTLYLYAKGVIHGLFCDNKLVGYTIMARVGRKHWKVYDFAVLPGFRVWVFLLGRAMTSQVPLGWTVEMHCRENTSLLPVINHATEHGFQVLKVATGETVGNIRETEVRGLKITQPIWEGECSGGNA